MEDARFTSKLMQLYVEPTQMIGYICPVCGSVNKFNPQCTACQDERYLDAQEYFDKLAADNNDAMDYASEFDPEDY